MRDVRIYPTARHYTHLTKDRTITINKKRTAIAPKYIITNTNPKKSQPIKKKITDALKKVKIKNNTELIGLVQKSIKHEEEIIIV